ncbi:CAP domain-containing protein [Acinetobacter courvalinii]|uniref:CAP domain-containing protein n=1 Tax=Acinetobacter courvalinii TaxID=280147 RepID=UPI0021CD5596|nr:CAP domain-containing protein [Acinetobacter courvalinii]MCU4390517.1 CAP domain-containing protein [Acinetobacter courvalinii]
MNPLKPLSGLICLMFLSACSSSTPATSQQQSFSVAQINQPTVSIRCQDIQNPAYQQAILNAINEIRQHPQQCGGQHFPAVAPLKWSHALSQSAFAHAQDMAQHSMLGHTSSTGHDFRSRLKTQFKGHGGGENVARGQNSLNEVMATWLASPVHCRNLMHPKFTDYAIACTVDQSAKQKTYWTQQFGVR